MDEQKLREIFATQKTDVPDEGFSERIIGQLPERKSMLPQIVMVVFVTVGLVLTFAIQGVTPFLEQINSLITSISRLQAPSPSSVIAYIGLLSLAGIIGYALVQADGE